jgi:hypothetical protein
MAVELFAIAHNATAPTRNAITKAAMGINPSHMSNIRAAKDF